ncbi:hypothetical protein HUT16_02750 [Kitasatospora sp. NA04385]|uniref:hypothetical protein n=1 Tax=Kitasatospora sp. NA04385 TaxID=2742135 RepID=UPI001590753F|nr:hypothetical protein [Kitasatospora sp. NA04385]QKW18122.1 hypothetical protein HUT16_02750 [Kitasatospora sp. NA04385]
MAQGTFQVEVDELGLVSKELAEANNSMGGAMHALGRTSPQVTGHRALDGACASFAEDWKYGLKQLNETLHAISEGLDVTVRAYRETDELVRRVMAGEAV